MMPDLPKIPAIWEHYQHHRTEHGENTLSFVEFLVDHFTGTDHQEADHATLPLHSMGVSVGVFVAAELTTDVQPYFAELTRTTYAQPDAKPYSQTYSKIWEPPRS